MCVCMHVYISELFIFINIYYVHVRTEEQVQFICISVFMWDNIMYAQAAVEKLFY